MVSISMKTMTFCRFFSRTKEAKILIDLRLLPDQKLEKATAEVLSTLLGEGGGSRTEGIGPQGVRTGGSTLERN